jgi:S-adenosylmethionine:tRNA ribosyltransferase-isomerase
MAGRSMRALAVDAPAMLAAAAPPEARGLKRDEVRLMVSHADARIEHLRFHQLPRVLDRGDLLVVNASATLNAALPARRTFGMRVDLHLSTRLPGGLWTVEVRQSDLTGSKPLRLGLAGEVLRLPDGGRASLLAPYPFAGDLFARARLWTAALELPTALDQYLDEHGRPIRYNYVPRPWPLAYYQTVFAAEPGSAEMPSAGRPFTSNLLAALRSAGVAIAPIVLHTGVSSLEDHEPPYEERFRVPSTTASLVNDTRAAGRRVIAVGTTVVRALESVTAEDGVVHPGGGWTDLVLTGDRPLRAVHGLITGLHEPKGSHLSIVRAVAETAASHADRRLSAAYDEAAERGYLLHEFGDSHVIMSR